MLPNNKLNVSTDDDMCTAPITQLNYYYPTILILITLVLSVIFAYRSRRKSSQQTNRFTMPDDESTLTQQHHTPTRRASVTISTQTQLTAAIAAAEHQHCENLRWLLDPHQIGRLPPPASNLASSSSPISVGAARRLHHSKSVLVPARATTTNNVLVDESVPVVSMRRSSLPAVTYGTRAALYHRSKTQPLHEHHIDGDENAPPPMPVALYRGVMLGMRFVYKFNERQSDGANCKAFCANVAAAQVDSDNNDESHRHATYCDAAVSHLLTPDQICECRVMQTLSHDNINLFVGIGFSFSTPCTTDTDDDATPPPPPITALIAFQHCPRSTLSAVLRSYDEATRTALGDWQFRQSLIDDIVHGLQYLHNKNVDDTVGCCFHGRLSSDAVVLDWRWCAKLTDFGMWSLGYADGPVQWLRILLNSDGESSGAGGEAEMVSGDEMDEDTAARKLLWVAPEIMRVPELLIKAVVPDSSSTLNGLMHAESLPQVNFMQSSSSSLDLSHKRRAIAKRRALIDNVQKADIYSLGIIMSEVVYQCSPPYSDAGLELRQVIDAVKCGILPKPNGFGRLSPIGADGHRNSLSGSLSAVKAFLRPCHEPLLLDAFDNNRQHLSTAEHYRQLMQLCWREAPNQRPDMTQIAYIIDEEVGGNQTDDDDDDVDDDGDINEDYSQLLKSEPSAQLSSSLFQQHAATAPLMHESSQVSSSTRDGTPQLQRQTTTRSNSSSVTRKTLHKLDKYAHALESLVERRTRELLDEKLRADALLARLMPIPIAERLKRGEPVEPEYFDSATVFFSDVVGFTTIAAHSTPMQVVRMLNQLYSQFDAICERYNVYKLETVGDAYVVVSGVPVRHARHVAEIAGMALEFLHLVQRQLTIDQCERGLPESQCVRMRMGINTGSVVAAVIGVNMPRYCMFGDTMNVAARMESHGEPMRIQLSHAAKVALQAWPDFLVEERGMCNVKGKGKMLTYWLLSGPVSRGA